MKKILLGFIMDGRSGGLDTYLLHFLDGVWEEGMQIDLLTNHADPQLKQQLKRYHSRLFEIANLKHPLTQFRQVRYLIRKEKYEMVYLNISTSMDLIAAFAAKSAHVPRRILHSHSGGNDCESPLKRVVFNTLQKICRPILWRSANEFYGCSCKAGYWMYPKKIVDSEKFHVIYNAVDRGKFVWRPEIREEVRQELKLRPEQFVVGHAGNFCYQKNHEFLIRIFKEIHKKDPNSVLLLAGHGVRMDQIRELVKKEGLEDSVRFLGWRTDADRLFQAMDVFLLPSNFEGLPTVGIEAQCTNLPCVISTAVTDETKITEKVTFVSLKDSPEVWADAVLAYRKNDRNQVTFYEEAKRYSLEDQKQRLKELVYGEKEQGGEHE